ncbi:MAG: isoprenoid biosynthesis glyoxalase ElbB [Deferribacterota bacterium]|nr:isoprenoid biosynthesis glyoxalase ElbB [Deferribacterota bacterium]
MAKIGVILSGCGVFDGNEVNEAVLTTYFLEKNGAEIQYMAPNINQLHVINHLNEEVEEGEARNVLKEAARITRGNINDIKDITTDSLDALFIPGGFGAAKNLTTFAVDGSKCKINKDVKRIILEMYNSHKPIGAICIAPVVVAKALEGLNKGIKITLGNDKNFAKAIEEMGAEHVNCTVSDYVYDEDNKILTTPAFMLAKSVLEASIGIEKTINKLMQIL